jgi:hypothetical protein
LNDVPLPGGLIVIYEVMRSRLTFYLFILVLIVLDAVLLRSPNLLGKIGLIIYKYHYLRTFPKAFITVLTVMAIAVIIAESIRWLVSAEKLGRASGRLILWAFIVLASAALIKTGLDFSTWTYSHTGQRFRYGAYLLPVILMIVFGYAVVTLPEQHGRFPESPIMKNPSNEDISQSP